MPKHKQRSPRFKPKSFSRRTHTRKRKGGPGNAGRVPTLTLKAFANFQADINTTQSYTKQINITPYLGLFPVALEQSKFYQQYRISRVSYTILPTTTTNTQTTAGQQSSPLMYSVALFNTSIPGTNEAAYLAYKNVRFTSLRGPKRGSFVPFVPTSE